jgi:hypothetical protein
MQGKLGIGAILVTVLAPSAAFAAEMPQRHGCSRGEASQQVQRAWKRLQQAQPEQPRNKPEGCPVNRMIPSVVDPTPTFLL